MDIIVPSAYFWKSQMLWKFIGKTSNKNDKKNINISLVEFLLFFSCSFCEGSRKNESTESFFLVNIFATKVTKKKVIILQDKVIQKWTFLQKKDNVHRLTQIAQIWTILSIYYDRQTKISKTESFIVIFQFLTVFPYCNSSQ